MCSEAHTHAERQGGAHRHSGVHRRPHAHTCTPCHSAHLCSPLCLFTPLRWKTWLKPGEERDTWKTGATACRRQPVTRKHLAVSIIVTLDLKGLTVALKKSSGGKGRLWGSRRMTPLFREVLNWHLLSTNPQPSDLDMAWKDLGFHGLPPPCLSTVPRPAHLRTSTVWGAPGGLS